MGVARLGDQADIELVRRQRLKEEGLDVLAIRLGHVHALNRGKVDLLGEPLLVNGVASRDLHAADAPDLGPAGLQRVVLKDDRGLAGGEGDDRAGHEGRNDVDECFEDHGVNCVGAGLVNQAAQDSEDGQAGLGAAQLVKAISNRHDAGEDVDLVPLGWADGAIEGLKGREAGAVVGLMVVEHRGGGSGLDVVMDHAPAVGDVGTPELELGGVGGGREGAELGGELEEADIMQQRAHAEGFDVFGGDAADALALAEEVGFELDTHEHGEEAGGAGVLGDAAGAAVHLADEHGGVRVKLEAEDEGAHGGGVFGVFDVRLGGGVLGVKDPAEGLDEGAVSGADVLVGGVDDVVEGGEADPELADADVTQAVDGGLIKAEAGAQQNVAGLVRVHDGGGEFHAVLRACEVNSEHGVGFPVLGDLSTGRAREYPGPLTRCGVGGGLCLLRRFAGLSDARAEARRRVIRWPMHTHAAILSTGDEVTLGQIADTNSRWLAQQLVSAGVRPVEHAVVPDELEDLTAAIARLARRAPLVVMTGGLGPTEGDLTRQAVAKLLGEELVVDDEAMAALTAMLAKRGREVSALQARQAMRPVSAACMPNAFGTAPGVRVVLPGKLTGAAWDAELFCLPGPPRELMPMWEGEVRSRLKTPAGQVVLTRLMHVTAIPEAEVAQQLKALTARHHDAGAVLTGMTASGGVITIRLRIEGVLALEVARGRLDETEGAIRGVLGDRVVAVDREGTGVSGAYALAASVIERLAARGEMLAVCESCSGGVLGAMLTAVAGSSRAVAGGFITYSNELKQALAGVPREVIERHGAVSAEVARGLATGTLERCGVEHALAITGIAGPGGGSAEKPVGTVFIARATRKAGAVEVDLRHCLVTGDREDVRLRSAVTALGLLHFALEGRGVGEPRMLWEKSSA